MLGDEIHTGTIMEVLSSPPPFMAQRAMKYFLHSVIRLAQKDRLLREDFGEEGLDAFLYTSCMRPFFSSLLIVSLTKTCKTVY